jgi:glycosyltransferase involved in cell wall biosynthesis
VISIVMPTCQRKARATKLIQQILDTRDNIDIELVCPVDADPGTAWGISEICEAARVQYAVPYNDELQGCMRAWNTGLAYASGDVVMFAADDMWPFPGWLTEALRVLKDDLGGHGLVGFNDLHQDGRNLATFWIADRRWIIEGQGGVMVFECYRYVYTDAESTERAKNAGRYRWASHAVLRHDHPDAGRREPDAHILRGRQFVGHDAALFAQRQAAGFPNDFAPVIM